MEAVRELLNTWLIDNHSRQPVEQLVVAGAVPRSLPAPSSERQLAELRVLRDELRQAIESGDVEPVQRWITDLTPRLRVQPPPRVSLRLQAADDSPAAEVVAAVAEAFSTGTWSRLRACRDCRWVFFDHSRSGSRIWCGMYATGPQGRACGSIAKTRRYRAGKGAAARAG